MPQPITYRLKQQSAHSYLILTVLQEDFYPPTASTAPPTSATTAQINLAFKFYSNLKLIVSTTVE